MKSNRLTIPTGSTIASIADGLKAPVEYVRNVLERLNEARREHCGDPRVRLALQSDPTAPDYEVIEIMDYETGQPMQLAAYSGRTHKAISFEKADFVNWSQENCSFQEVKDLIGILRKANKS